MSIPNKYLTEKVILTEAHVDNKSILRILTQDKQINNSDPNYSHYSQLADWANTNQQKIKPIDLTIIELSNRQLIKDGKLNSKFNTLGHVLVSLKNLMDNQGRYDSKNPTSQLIQKTTLEILEYLKEGPKLYQGMDWTAEKAKRLANAGENTSGVLDEFYNDYYKIEYAGLSSPNEEDTTGIVDKLKSLDKILIQEFNKLGYNPSVNPLAQFLKILIEHRKELKIFEKLTPNNYGAIHNSFIDRKLTGNMLGNYNGNHILFCEDLYNYKGLDIVKYLKLYKETLDKAESTVVEPPHDKWVLAAKIFIQQDLSSTKTTSNIQFKDKVNMLLNKQGVRIPTADNAKLRSFVEIEELYTSIFKAAPNTEKPKEDKTLKLIVDEAKEHNVLLDMIYRIANSEAFKKVYPEPYSTIAKQLKGFTPSRENLETCEKILALHNKNIAKQDWLTLINKLNAARKASNKKVSK